VGCEQGAAADVEVVPRNVEATVEWGSSVILSPAGLTIGRGLAKNAEMRPTGESERSCRLIAAKTLATAGSVEPDSYPIAAWLVVESNRVALRPSEWALTSAAGQADEGSTTVSGERRSRNVDRARVTASRIVVGYKNLARIVRISQTVCF